MTVAHVVLTLDQGGLEHLVMQISEQLQRRGIRSPIVVLTGGTLVDEARRRGIEVFTLGKRQGLDLRVIRSLVRVIVEKRIDVLHTHNMAPLVYGTLAARLRGKGTVNTRHGRAALRAHRLIWALTDRVVAVSEDAKRELLAHNRIAQAKVEVILNAIDLAPYHDLSRRSVSRDDLGIPTGVPAVITVGRLSVEKDQATLVSAFRRVVDSGSPSHLAIVGGGPLDSELRAQVRSLGLESRVHMLGVRTDVPALLPLFDVFALSSTMEGVSLTLLEAMASALPVVATRVGGNPEVVRNGETGYLVAPGHAGEFADALRAVLEDPARAARMGARGRTVALETFDITLLVDRYVELYRQVRRVRGRDADAAAGVPPPQSAM